jgi:acetyl esterase/lipase
MEPRDHKRPTFYPFMSRSPVYGSMFIFTLSVLMLSCGDANDPKGTRASEKLSMSDVSYGPDRYHILDLSLPAGRNSQTPLVVFIHGGGWREGSKEQYTTMVDDFVAQGFATASINYRPANADAHITYIELLEDIDLALQYLQDNASQNVYNGKKVTLFGHSAGAHLALLYAYRNNERDQVRSVISLSAPTDLANLLEEGIFPTLLYNIVGSDDLEKFKDASPITHATPASVPTFFIHGRADESVPYQQSQMLFDELAQWNRMVNRIELIDHEGHDFSAEVQEAIVAESIAYLHTMD